MDRRMTNEMAGTLCDTNRIFEEMLCRKGIKKARSPGPGFFSQMPEHLISVHHFRCRCLVGHWGQGKEWVQGELR